MKKLYMLAVLILCSGIQVNGIEFYENGEIAIDGLDRNAAQAIYNSLEVLSNNFGKIYNPNASQGANSSRELSSFVEDLKQKTTNFAQLSAVVLNIEQAIEKNDGKAFWQEEGYLRSLLRPTFRLFDAKKAKPVGWYEALKNYIFGKQKKSLPLDLTVVQEPSQSQGYIARAVGSVTGAVSSFYNWLFSGQGVQVE